MSISAEGALALLARVSVVLGSAVDWRASLEVAARELVPELGDACTVHLHDGATASRCVAHAHADAAVASRLGERVLRSTTHDDQDDGGRLCVPLRMGEGAVLGVLTVTRARSGPFTANERLVAEEIGRRLAMVVDHARSLEHAQVISERFEAMLSELTDGIVIQDAQGRLLFANDSLVRLCGLVSNRSAFENGPPDGIVERLGIYDDHRVPFEVEKLPGRIALRSGQPAEAIIGSRHSGGERWAMVRATPIHDERGELRMVINVVHDITKKKLGEESQRFLAEASAALGGTLDIDAIARNLVSFLAPAHVDVAAFFFEDRAREPARAGIGSERMLLARDVPLLRDAFADGAPRHRDAPLEIDGAPSGVHAHGVVPLVGRERVEGVLLLGFASPDRRASAELLALIDGVAQRAGGAIENARLYREAGEAITARDVFLSVASHELKTPLTSLRLQAQSIARDLRKAPVPLEVMRPKVDAVEQQLRRLTELVNGLLDVSRITGRRLRLHPEPTCLAAIAREVVARFEPVFVQRGCELHMELPAAMEGTWDRMRLDQAVTNLVSNACKYGGGGRVAIALREREGFAELSVRDQGIGIQPRDQARIFERFERAVAEHHYGGFGMGLWIAREIVEAHGGHIVVESAPGRGSTFTIELPTEVRPEIV